MECIGRQSKGGKAEEAVEHIVKGGKVLCWSDEDKGFELPGKRPG